MSKRAMSREMVAGAVALGVLAGPAGAVGLTNVKTNDVNIAYWILDQATCKEVYSPKPGTQAGLNAIVQGTKTLCVPGVSPGPGGNIELGDVDSLNWVGASVMTGTLPRGSITLSSLLLADWLQVMPSGERLADQYLADAVAANCGERPPVDGFFTAFVDACFLGGSCLGYTVNPPPAQRASDPNIYYANQDGAGGISIGLAGGLDVSDLLPPSFVCPNTGQKPDPLRASEVVKFSAAWASTQYLYSFSAFPSGTSADDPTNSQNSDYELSPQLPPPKRIPTLPLMGWLLGLLGMGLIGVRGLRRRPLAKT